MPIIPQELTTIILALIGLGTAWIGWQVDKVHKSVNSTASALADKALVKDIELQRLNDLVAKLSVHAATLETAPAAGAPTAQQIMDQSAVTKPQETPK